MLTRRRIAPPTKKRQSKSFKMQSKPRAMREIVAASINRGAMVRRLRCVPVVKQLVCFRATRPARVVQRLGNHQGINNVPVIRNSLVGLARYLGKFRDLNQIEEFHCHSFFSELKPLPVVVQ
jgi:hypothetical protein